ncbi:MAG: hypothetical protein JSR45_02885 [Proteobacteria bacterium]|nr:hypothetical protein [Pseudomonadota bacterium]
MSRTDKRPEEPVSFEEGDRVCAELSAQIERARQILRDYREVIAEEPQAVPKSDPRPPMP